MDAKTNQNKTEATATGRSYPDLHDHIRAIEEAGMLVRVDRPINKDTEMHPLVRWQFRGGIEEKDRKAFLFTNVVDSKGNKYDIPVLVGGLAANREIYRLGLGCAFEEMDARWIRATQNPLPPRIVENAPCHEIVITGDDLDRPGQGLDGIPLPISTPGWDISPYATLSQYITKDPETGIQNMGNYRGQVKSPRRLGMNPSLELRPGIYNHWQKLREQGFKKLPAAVVLGAPPCVTFASVQKLPETLDELEVAGALVGSPLNVVRAKTVDLLVPAEAEIVIEGFIDTEYLEPEAPFGESHGHINLQEFNAFMDITAITRRRDAVLTSIISQVTPSESSLIKKIGMEPLFLNFLRNTLGIKCVKRVSLHEPLTNIRKVLLLVMDRDAPTTEIWRALYGAAVLHRAAGKYVIAINDDIDPENTDAIFWAMSYRANPNLDFHILPHRDQGHGPRSQRNGGQDGSVLIDATLKEKFPPISLPKREYMERAKQIWEELGLPKLKPEAPWFGYSLGEWSPELDEAAARAARGDYFETGKEIEKRRRKDLTMNTEVRTVKE
ncbi:MAG TPA: UbiD family decarboxylase [Pseudolabrys sp.]|jgi:4-hydroxy-3-polyprenylbenzoate decarboxylase|uniref:UbiD family decarboxylase n=1 Tax=Pseudolabrys sp. TaxID=1960880 RepID=UPI002DDD72D5|nr:UbiD family decarboxylase [Pseudolabrys sp.]HEV2628425.1 UbiD family decarboxylase [Pseudolabrys sp.]